MYGTGVTFATKELFFLNICALKRKKKTALQTSPETFCVVCVAAFYPWFKAWKNNLN